MLGGLQTVTGGGYFLPKSPCLRGVWRQGFLLLQPPKWQVFQIKMFFVDHWDHMKASNLWFRGGGYVMCSVRCKQSLERVIFAKIPITEGCLTGKL